jgi:hypothetical protein
VSANPNMSIGYSQVGRGGGGPIIEYTEQLWGPILGSAKSYFMYSRHVL